MECKTCVENGNEIIALSKIISDMKAVNEKLSIAQDQKIALLCEKVEKLSNAEEKPSQIKASYQWFHNFDQALKSYQSSFTMHGLPHILTGKLFQRICWGILTLGVLILALYMTNKYTKRYLKKDIRTEIRYVNLAKIHLPAITVFVKNDIFDAKYACLNGQMHDKENTSRKLKHCGRMRNISVDVANATMKKYEGHVVVNENETYVQKSRGKVLLLKVNLPDANKNEEISLIFESKKERENRKTFSFVSQYQFDTGLVHGKYDIHIEKEIIKRLPAPYRSNCSSNKNQFSDMYTIPSCEEQCLFNKVFETCGDVPDIWKTFRNKTATPYKGSKYPNQAACIWHILDANQNEALSLSCKCPSECNIVLYRTHVKYREPRNVSEWEFAVRYSTSRRETTITQVPDYTLEDFLGAMGGFIGLCVGASLLSVIELLLYSILYIVTKVMKRIQIGNRVHQEVA